MISLDRHLRRVASSQSISPRPLSNIEQRAAQLRSRSRVGAMLAVVVFLVAASVGVSSNWDFIWFRPQSRVSRNVAPAAQPTSAPTTNSTAICQEVDACGSENERLARDEEWLGARLAGAGMEYKNAYRPDGGGGHVNFRYGFQIWVLRPTREKPQVEAARWGYRPFWSHGGTTVYGSAGPESPVAYFYWRAGTVDTFVELDWAASEANQPDELRGVFERIIEEQEQQPYPLGP